VITSCGAFSEADEIFQSLSYLQLPQKITAADILPDTSDQNHRKHIIIPISTYNNIKNPHIPSTHYHDNCYGIDLLLTRRPIKLANYPLSPHPAISLRRKRPLHNLGQCRETLISLEGQRFTWARILRITLDSTIKRMAKSYWTDIQPHRSWSVYSYLNRYQPLLTGLHITWDPLREQRIAILDGYLPL